MESGGNVSFLHRFELVFAFVLIYEVCLFELRQNPFTASEERAVGVLDVLVAVVGGVEMYVKEKKQWPWTHIENILYSYWGHYSLIFTYYILSNPIYIFNHLYLSTAGI